MKKLVITLGLFCLVGFSTSELLGQAPVTRTNAAAQTSTTTQVDRQVKKGDAQLSRANTSYQRAQSTMSTTTTSSRPASSSTTARPVPSSSRTNASSVSRPTTSNASYSNTVRPNTTAPVNRTNVSTNTSTTRPAASSTVSRPTASSTVNTSTTAVTRPNASTTVRTPASSNTVSSSSTTSSNRISANVSSQATTVRTNPGAASNSNVASSNMEARRGYNPKTGEAQPQMAPVAPKGNEPVPDFKCNPYVHPNFHNFGHQMRIPNNVRPVYYHGMPYYFYNSIFYRHLNGYYVACRPPFGAVIARAIFHTWNPVIVVFNKMNYYYDDGSFYTRRNNDYVVVAPPIGARVAELPSNYEELILDGRLYFKVDNVYYKEVIIGGYLWYEVIFVSQYYY